MGLPIVNLVVALLLSGVGLVAIMSRLGVFGEFRSFVREHSMCQLMFLMAFALVFIVHGSTKTNLADGAESGPGETNSPPAGLMMRSSVRLMSSSAQPTVTQEDIARGWQLVRTETDSVDCTMPEGASFASNWWMRGACDDVKRIGFGSFRFPFGDKDCSYLWAFAGGKVRFRMDELDAIAAVGSTMSAVPRCSRLWFRESADSFLVTWECFVPGRAPVGSSVTKRVDAQVELFRSGDFVTRSNGVKKVYRRIDPEDWDDDGIPNGRDPHPYARDGDCFGPHQTLPEGANADAYCWVDLVTEVNAHVTFTGDGPSDLPDPDFMMRAGETNRVILLIGKTYNVTSTRPLVVVAKSDPAIEVTGDGTSGPVICWPVTFTVGDGMSPSGLLGATWNDGGSAFHVLTTPAFLGGVFDWDDGGCCSVWGDGVNFAFQCDNACGCEGCTVYGYYGYEGYRLPVGGVSCGCRYVEDDGPADVVEFGFTKAAAVYEDPYTNMPGVVIHPSPSNTVLRCVVSGGTYGGRLTVSLNAAGDSRIRRVGGNALPTDVEIAPGTRRTFETEYTPVAPSESEGDIVATLTYTENFLGTVHSDTAMLTSIKLQLTAVYDAPENHNPSRHVYGVGEEVRFDVCPASAEIFLVTERYDTADDSGYGYELFGTRERVAVPYASEYRCPVSASNAPPVRVCYKGSEYWPAIKIVEPEEIVTTGASWGENAVDLYYDGDRKCWPYGTVGSAALVTTNYVGPMHVSFQGVAFSEVPCEDEDVVTGCFATNHIRTHTPQAGAGKLHMIYEKNFFFVDGARSGAPELNWQPCSTMNWKIPIGWHRIRSDYADGKQLYGPDYERCKDDKSRKLLIGGRNDKYMQNRYIDENGTYRTEKFGHWISRSRWCRVILDGRTLQERHVEQ